MQSKSHSEMCIRATAARQQYQAQWPSYCKKCEGRGGFWYSYDPSAPGVSLSPGSMEDFEPCPNCAEEGICGRCGQDVLGSRWQRRRIAKWLDGWLFVPMCNWLHKRGKHDLSYRLARFSWWIAGPVKWDDMAPCIHCGWSWGSDNDDGMPDYGCECFLADMYEEGF